MNQKKKITAHWRLLLIGALAMLFISESYSQSFQKENQKLIKETNKLLSSAGKDLAEDDFASAEATYRKAVSKSPDNVAARYNMANMYYGKEKPAQAATRLRQAAKIAETKEEKHKIFHNLGNSFMEQKQYREAVEAYKDALRNNPKDEETRYNLALAKKMLEEEEPEGGGEGDDEDQDQDQQDQDQGDGENEDQDQDQQEGENNEDEGGDQENESQQQPEDQGESGTPEQDEQGEPQQPQPQEGQLSPEQIKSLLEAMNNEERKVQDKINAEKSKGAKTRNEKDW